MHPGDNSGAAGCVFCSLSDGLNRPGGNVTGVTFLPLHLCGSERCGHVRRGVMEEPDYGHRRLLRACRQRPRRRRAAEQRDAIAATDVGLPCDPPVGGHSCNGRIYHVSIAQSVTEADSRVE
jgi:hypothetical protein